MGGMGSLYIGVSGLQASQNALNTTAHNLSNITTEGYVRQQVVQSDTLYNTIKYGAVSLQQIGIGTTIAQVRQVRDIFLDQAYRLEVGRTNFYEVGYATYHEIESILGTLGGAEFSDSLKGLKEAFNQLSTDPSDTSYQTLLKQRAGEFLDSAQDVHTLLKEYQLNINDQVVDTIDRINVIANKIFELNKKISAIEAGGIENANDLRDTRNSYLDELSGLINITYTEDKFGVVTVKAESVPLVGDNFVYEMGYKTDKVTGFVTPTWPDYKDMEVYDMSATISTGMNTDVGKLKALLLHRGTKVTNYTDIPRTEDYQDGSGKWLTGNWTIDGVTYTDGEKAYGAAKNYYNTYTALSGMMNTLAEFDQLIHGIVTTINDLLCPNTTITVGAGEVWKDANGNVLTEGASYTVLDVEKSGRASDGAIGVELFSRTGTERYTKYTYTNAAGEEQTIYVYNGEDTTKNSTMYTLDNLTINSAVLNDVGKLPLYKADGSVNRPLGEALYAAWSTKFAALNPNAASKLTFEDYYNKLYTDVGNMGYIYKGIYDSESNTTSEYDSNRQMVLGVSSDEELTNMIKYQNAYNASSRYINVVSEMLEHIITTLGRG